jgi:N-acetylglucosaminyl-diphospho-decaprenol L-rhamnosyltransferase
LSQVALSIVSHGQGALVELLLNDLRALNAGSFDLLVLTLNVDEPVPPAFLAEAPWRKILIRNSERKGFGANHNAAFEKAYQRLTVPNAKGGERDRSWTQDDYWVVLNPDLRIKDVDCFTRLKAGFEANIELVAPAVIEDGAIAPSARGLYTPYQAIKAYLGFARDFKNPPDWIAGMFLMFRASIYAKLNGFDSRYFMYCEDVDICLRLQLGGGQIRYMDQIVIEHVGQRASHRSMRALKLHLISAFRLWTSASFWLYWAKPRR